MQTAKELRVPAIEVCQGPGRLLYSFAAAGKVIPSFATVSRIRRNGNAVEGYQRPEVLKHILEIRNYLEGVSPLIPNAIIIASNVRPDRNAADIADREKVDIRTYRVIYDAVEDVRSALEGMLAPERKEIVLGEAEVRQVFKISGVGTIAGCLVRSGTIRRGARIRVVRDAVVVYDGDIASLKRFKDDVREVKEGLEGGIGVQDFNDVKVRDVLEAYRIEEVARTLESAGVVKEG